MSKDIANIYDLPDNLLAKYKENPWPDNETRPGTKEFATKFKQEIINTSTPYVLALEGGYGVGKTYFITRFCEHLRNKNFDEDISIDSIYLNLWENDYVANPFPVIASQIISVLDPTHEQQESIKENAIKITNNLLKFGAKLASGMDIGDVLPNLKQDKNDIRIFKNNLQKIITEKGGKVVLVVDELDRCKPDYAVKTLEALKHFFNIEGLFIILTTRIDFMDCICDAHYGHPKSDNTIGERYIQKFVQSAKTLASTTKDDYAFIVQKFLDEKKFPEIGSYVTKRQEIGNFINFFVNTFYKCKFSLRRTIDACNEIMTLITNPNTKDLFENKVAGYPEWAVVLYLKAKNILPTTTSEPEVNWQHAYGNITEIKEDVLKRLL